MAWSCFHSHDSGSDSDEVDYSLRAIYQRSLGQPQQPHLLFQSICNFFKKCLCCGTSDSEMSNTEAVSSDSEVLLPFLNERQSICDFFKKDEHTSSSSTLPTSEFVTEVDQLILNTNRSDPLDVSDGTRDNGTRAGESQVFGAGTQAAGTQSDGIQAAGTRTSDNLIQHNTVDQPQSLGQFIRGLWWRCLGINTPQHAHPGGNSETETQNQDEGLASYSVLPVSYSVMELELDPDYFSIDRGERRQSLGRATIPAAMEKLTSSTFSASVHKEKICVVCQEEFVDTESLTSFPCKHYYHTTCIVLWLETKNTCPTCRYQLSG